MAGDWIKMRVNLLDDPAVIAIGEAVGMDEYAVSGRLFKLWAWADQHTADGTIAKVGLDSVDRRIGVPGFGKAMCDVGWLLLIEGGIQFPNFDRHNGKTGKARALTAKRVARHKSQDNDEGNGSANDEVTPSALPREEKRREEKIFHPTDESNTPQPPELAIQFVEVWNATPGVRQCRSVTSKRRKAFHSRAAEGEAWDWRKALGRFPLRCFADDPDGWQPDIDWFLRPDTVTKILEGKYDWSKADRNGRPNPNDLSRFNTPGAGEF